MRPPEDQGTIIPFRTKTIANDRAAGPVLETATVAPVAREILATLGSNALTLLLVCAALLQVAVFFRHP